MNEQVTIYGLCDDTGVRYIGQTRQPLTMRVYQHRFDLSTGGAAKIAWIKALRAAGQKPGVIVLEVVTPANATEAEKRHIALARERGSQLLNVLPGGERGRQPNDERDVVRVALRLPVEVHAALERMSLTEERSLHAEIVHCLRHCTGQPAPQTHRRRATRAAIVPPAPPPEHEEAG